MRNVIEFYEETMIEGKTVSKLLTVMDTVAPPPPVGAKINMLSIDYVVELIDYSIDTSGMSLTYRRNVWLKKV